MISTSRVPLTGAISRPPRKAPIAALSAAVSSFAGASSLRHRLGPPPVEQLPRQRDGAGERGRLRRGRGRDQLDHAARKAAALKNAD